MQELLRDYRASFGFELLGQAIHAQHIKVDVRSMAKAI